MKKLIALVLAAVMMMTVVSAFAAGTGVNLNSASNGKITIGPSEAPEFDNGAFSTTAEDTISVSGLDEGDTVYYYQLLAWDPEYAEANADPERYGWELTTNGTTAGITVQELLNGISVEEAGTIATNLSSLSAADGNGKVTGTSWSKNPVDPGLYYIKVVAKDPDTIYNPIFVSADYYAGNNTVATTEFIASSSVVKKSKVTFDKDAVEGTTQTDKFNDVAPGDEIDFQIVTKIPAYGKNYTNATFKIEDQFVGPLTLKADSITVKYGTKTATATNDDVTITPGSKNFTIDFKKDYLIDEGRAVTDVTVTYKGVVSSNLADFPNNVTEMDNTAKLTFSRNPNETTEKDDITRHYTFSIDGKALGKGDEYTSELIKVGIDENGNIIEESEVTYRSGEKKSPLAGATFTLVGTTDDGVAISRSVTTGTDGRIHFEGLDVGTYTLTETAAPKGYVRDTTTYEVKIDAKYGKDGQNDDDVADVLLNYTVTIKNNTSNEEGTATFVSTSEVKTFALASEEKQVTSTTYEDMNGFIQNRQGNELPSTGGIGTTIFYMIGGLMVLAAGIVLVSRRKAEEE